MRAVEGPFDKGDAVACATRPAARWPGAWSRYDTADAHKIAGLRSDAIEAELGCTDGPMIHADDLAVGG